MKRSELRGFHDAEILINGTPIEQIPIEQTALHYDDAIVKRMCYAIMGQAVRDWKELNRKGQNYIIKFNGEQLHRVDILRFFNSSFFGEILMVIAPNVDQETALRNMDRYEMKPNMIGFGRGKTDPEKRWRLI